MEISEEAKELLRSFSPEAREYAASRVYDKKTAGGHVCADGRCVMANLLYIDHPKGYEGVPDEDKDRPCDDEILEAMGLPVPEYVPSSDDPEYREYRARCAPINQIITLNDRGDLATPEAVRELFASL